MGTKKKLQWLGLPLYLWIILVAITIAGLFSGKMGTDFGSTIFWLTVLGTIIMEAGNRLPIVKDYLGGGPLLILILGSFATWANIIPEAYVEATNTWMAGFNVQAFFLTLLIVSSVMTIDKKTLARSLIGYLPCIFGGLIGAAIFAALIGILFFHLDIGEILMTYVMPIMGGGSAAGALPMSAIYEEITGKDKDVYYCNVCPDGCQYFMYLFRSRFGSAWQILSKINRQWQPASSKRRLGSKHKQSIPTKEQLHNRRYGQWHDADGWLLGTCRVVQQMDPS